MIKTISVFLEGRLLSIQSEQSKKFSKSPDWLKKMFWSYKQAKC